MYAFELFADYFQFYLQDEAAVGDLSYAWSPEAEVSRMAVAPGTIGIGTARNMTVPVVVEIHPAEPPESLDGWDHVAEAGMTVRSGTVVIAGCTVRARFYVDNFVDLLGPVLSRRGV